jgi:cytochrome c553
MFKAKLTEQCTYPRLSLLNELALHQYLKDRKVQQRPIPIMCAALSHMSLTQEKK